MKRILIISVIPSDFEKLLSLALLLRENNYSVEFYFEQRTHSLEDSINKAKGNNFVVHNASKQKHKQITQNVKTKGKFGNLKGSRPLLFIYRLFIEIKKVNALIYSFKKILRKSDISLVITPINSVGYNLPVYLNVCRELDVISVCFPFAIGGKDAFAKSVLYSFQRSPKYLYNSFFGFFLKEWRIKLPQGSFLVLSAEQILTYLIKGIKVKIPSSFYGVKVDYLFLENEFMKKYAISEKIASDSVKVTGSMLDDELFQIAKEKEKNYIQLCVQHGLDCRRKLILIALPPLIKNDDSDYRLFHFDELLKRFISETTLFSDYNVLVNLHPRIAKYGQHSFGNGSHVRFSTDPVELIIPLCDLFISTFSSTIRTAVALNKPVINYDLLNFNYTMFKDLPHIKTISSADQYYEQLYKWIKEEKSLKTKNFIDDRQNLLASTLDGKSKRRILQALNEALEIS